MSNITEKAAYDIAVIGLGPAGATVARLLSSKFKIIAIDKKSGEDKTAFSKPCGGLLAPDAQKALSKFNLTLPKDVLVDPQIFAVKTLDLNQNLTRLYQRFYLNIDRRKFDLWLMSLIPENVEVITAAKCKSIQKSGGLYELTYMRDSVERKITARYVIGADGSNSIVRNALFPKRKIRRYTAIQQWFKEKHPVPFYSCVFSRLTKSYCWSVSKDGDFILGGAFPKKNCRARFEQLKEKLSGKGFVLGEPFKTEACLVSDPRRMRDFCTGKDGAFLVGEAAGFISPSSLEGISYALNSARILAEALSFGKNPSRVYRKKTFKIRAKLLFKRLKRPFIYNRFLRKIVMKAGIGSIKK